MGGRRCLEELLSIRPDVKVLVASGFSPDWPTGDPLKTGAKGFVSKPFDVNKLMKTVRDVLDEA
jgi:DNA-binding NarL/FixJ family response regulator